MKIITKKQNNVVECTCGTVFEYDRFDLIPKNVEKTNYYLFNVTCPFCGKSHIVEPVGFNAETSIDFVKSDKKLSTMSVKELSLAANSPYAEEIFNIHDRRTITLKNEYKAVFEIIGINHDIREDGKRAGLTFCLVDLYGTVQNDGRAMNDECTNAGGFEKSAMFKWLNEDFFALLPDEWQEIIVPVVKRTASGGGSKARIVDTTCKIFIPSEVEVFGECRYSKKGEGEQYEGFEYWKDRIKGYRDGNYSRWYWLRSPYSDSFYNFCMVGDSGSYDSGDAYGTYGVAPCFAI